MQEVEVKLALDDPEKLQAAAQRAGAHDLGTVQLRDTYWTHPARDLAAADEAVRSRWDGTAWTLTWKGPRAGGPVKSREEIEVAMADDPGAWLEAVGFRRFAVLEKARHAWRLGRVTLSHDHADGLGDFVEVEAVADDAAQAAQDVAKAIRTLGIEGLQRVRDSYLELALARGLVGSSSDAATGAKTPGAR